MIKKEYGKEYSLEEREQFLRNTCDGMEEDSVLEKKVVVRKTF